MGEEKDPIAVIGAGFSGTMTALHLLSSVPGRRVLLCERGPTFARGTAYGTEDPGHLLNVRAGNMSAFQDRPDHFVDWLATANEARSDHRHETSVGLFVSRALYGRYLTSLVTTELGGAEGARRLRIVPDEAVALRRVEGGGFDLRLAGGRSHRVAGAVVAAGNLAAPGSASPGAIVPDPWAVRFTDGLVAGVPVVVLGTGLTMVDVVTSLVSSGFAGPVLAISRRGLLPRMHAPAAAWRLSHVDPSADGPLSGRLRSVRREVREAAAAGLPWQSVVDALRPFTAGLWRAMSEAQQARFIRHLRPWWDVHRHRMAPPVGQHLHGLVERGHLRVAAGHLCSMHETDLGGVAVRWRPRGHAGVEEVAAQRVIMATGAVKVDAARDALLDGLLRSGLARVDRHGLGLDVTDELQLVGEGGDPVPGLWAIGPIVRGAFWECTAVPDIRSDARRLATQVARSLAG